MRSYFDSFGNSSLYATGQFLHYSFLGLCMVQVRCPTWLMRWSRSNVHLIR